MWHSVKEEGCPPEYRRVVVTIERFDGKRSTISGARYIKDLAQEGYADEFCKEHPEGIWEWPYEAGADYWEPIEEKVIAWAECPEPYEGE